MRLRQAWLVAAHDLYLIRQRRATLYALVAYPIAVSIGFPLLVSSLVHQTGPGGLPLPTLKELIASFSFWYVIGAGTLPVSIAAYSIVGEKVEKSLEPLLSTPTTDSEILLGKTLAAFLPSMAAVWSGSVLFMVLVDHLTRSTFGYYVYPNVEIAIVLLLLAPLACLFAIEVTLLLSSWASDVRTVQQVGSLLFLPFILLYVLSEVGVVSLDDPTELLALAGVLALVVLVLFSASRAVFHREEILTRWK